MEALQEGTVIRLTNGKTCTVDKELGRGGQGIVYLVDYCGGDYALKWYTKEYTDAFYNNLKANADSGAPCATFLWPLAVTEKQQGSFGYVMKLRPRGYYEFGAFMLAKVQFANVRANINAALKICDAFQKLHIRGFSYQDMNDGNFFINPRNGDVLICDNDNVAPDRTNLGIIGKAGYLAPEIVEKKNLPNRYSDYFSMAVMLFLIFYFNRPFEGRLITSCPCMTEDIERTLFGSRAVFIMDPDDDSNRPVRGVHDNVLHRWGMFPQMLQEKFIQAFCKQSLMSPNKRVIDRDWMNTVLQLRAMLCKCPLCGEDTFVDPYDSVPACIDCEMSFQKPLVLKLDNFRIPLLPGKKIYAVQLPIEAEMNSEVGEVVTNSVTNRLGIKNFSSFTWQAIDPLGDAHNINPGDGLPIKNGMSIKFKMGIKAQIIK